MSLETSQEISEDDSATGQAGQDVDTRPVVRLGLVPSPEQCQRIAEDIADSVREALSEHVDDMVTWEIVVQPDPLTGSNVEVPDLLDEIQSWREDAGWDFAICLTDLPVRCEGRIVVVLASTDRELGFISVPALGVIRLRSRVRAMILQLMEHMHHGTSSVDVEDLKVSTADAQPSHLVEDEVDLDIGYTAPRIRGHLKLLTGMVYANQPWRVFPSFRTTVAAALATGSYGLVLTTLWELGNAYGTLRLVTLMIVSLVSLVTWIVISHGLWVHHGRLSFDYMTTMYNVTTVLTIATGVVFFYVVIYLLLLLSALLFVPNSMLEGTLQHSIAPVHYLDLAWVTASVSTLVGAFGSSLEDTDKVRNATFGWRQKLQYEKHEKEKDTSQS